MFSVHYYGGEKGTLDGTVARPRWKLRFGQIVMGRGIWETRLKPIGGTYRLLFWPKRAVFRASSADRTKERCRAESAKSTLPQAVLGGIKCYERTLESLSSSFRPWANIIFPR